MKLSDMLFANAMMGEGGGGGGGGGGGDFTTANVTVINQKESNYEPQSCTPFAVDENAMGEGSPACIFSPITVAGGETAIFTVPLYKGGCIWGIGNDVSDTSGNITRMGPYLFIAGDGSITIPEII